MNHSATAGAIHLPRIDAFDDRKTIRSNQNGMHTFLVCPGESTSNCHSFSKFRVDHGRKTMSQSSNKSTHVITSNHPSSHPLRRNKKSSIHIELKQTFRRRRPRDN